MSQTRAEKAQSRAAAMWTLMACAKQLFMGAFPFASKQPEDVLVPRFEGWTQLF